MIPKISFIRTCNNCATDLKVNALWFCCTTCKTQYKHQEYAVRQILTKFDDQLMDGAAQ